MSFQQQYGRSGGCFLSLMSPAWRDEVIGDVFSEPQQALSLCGPRSSQRVNPGKQAAGERREPDLYWI